MLDAIVNRFNATSITSAKKIIIKPNSLTVLESRKECCHGTLLIILYKIISTKKSVH